MKKTFAMAGNPNCGKTTFFNELTGARQHVGNYPGVTVEKREGVYIHNNSEIYIVDLPGTYSLTAYSLEEVVARNYIVNEKPDVVINIVDASNLERNLYLTLQFLELGTPICIALNMIDVAIQRGIEIDINRLSDLLDIPIVPTIARKGEGIKRVIEESEKLCDQNNKRKCLEISYGRDIDQALDELKAIIISNQFLTDTYPSRWIALKYLENDEQMINLGKQTNTIVSDQLEKIVKTLTDHLQNTIDTYPEAEIADHRYGYIKSIIKQGVVNRISDKDRLFITDRIDKYVTHRFLGPLIMIAVIAGLYKFTFSYSEVPITWLESFFGWISDLINANLPDGLFKSLILSGIIDGVGGVLGFVPLIMFMFFGISIIEDSGYLSRVSFMMDRIFRIFGLHGSSVMAFIISGGIAGGCAVPGIMATRTLKSNKERLATILTVPFMNCGAKLPIFALLVAAFFSENRTMIMFVITIISWSGALLIARLLRSTIIKGDTTPFVMELPPYRFPTFKGLMIHTWERTWQYIKKAGTVILAISIVLWAMMTFPNLPDERAKEFDNMRNQVKNSYSTKEADKIKEKLLEIDQLKSKETLMYSFAGRIGTSLESITQLAGFDWRTNIALIGGFAAKEVIVSTLGIAYSLGELDSEDTNSLAENLKNNSKFNPLTAWSLIIFTIFYAPCFVSVVCIVREAGSWKWGAFSMIFNTILAFCLSVIVYQTGTFLM